jgi:fatty acid desaturase
MKIKVNIPGWVLIVAVVGVAVPVQSYIPGVRNMSFWVFPLMTGIVMFALLAFHTAAGYRMELDQLQGRNKSMEKVR